MVDAWLHPLHAMAQPAASAPRLIRPRYYFLLGRYYESQGESDKAIARTSRRLAWPPESAELRAELAGVYARQDRAVEAVDTAEEALKLDPENREANRISDRFTPRSPNSVRAHARATIPRSTCRGRLRALERAREDGGAELGLELTLGRLYAADEGVRQGDSAAAPGR